MFTNISNNIYISVNFRISQSQQLLLVTKSATNLDILCYF